MAVEELAGAGHPVGPVELEVHDRHVGPALVGQAGAASTSGAVPTQAKSAVALDRHRQRLGEHRVVVHHHHPQRPIRPHAARTSDPGDAARDPSSIFSDAWYGKLWATTEDNPRFRQLAPRERGREDRGVC